MAWLQEGSSRIVPQRVDSDAGSVLAKYGTVRYRGLVRNCTNVEAHCTERYHASHGWRGSKCEFGPSGTS
jgi:hypothetical protein